MIHKISFYTDIPQEIEEFLSGLMAYRQRENLYIWSIRMDTDAEYIDGKNPSQYMLQIILADEKTINAWLREERDETPF